MSPKITSKNSFFTSRNTVQSSKMRNYICEHDYNSNRTTINKIDFKNKLKIKKAERYLIPEESIKFRKVMR